MRILVTGSEGSLMQWVIPKLIESGHEVTGVDNFFRYGRSERERDYEFVEGDLTNESLVKEVLVDKDIVIQAAARIFGVKGFHKYPADILNRDVVLHQHIMWHAKEQQVQKVVYISSSMVYERCETVPSYEEEVDEQRVPYTDYGLSKLMGERLCRAFRQQYGLDYTIWRPFNIITPLEEAEEEQGIAHVFADFVQRLLVERKNPMPIFGDGEQVRCFTWIDDVASAIAAHLEDPRTSGEAFNLGNPRPVTMKDLAQKIFDLGRKRGLDLPGEKLKFDHIPIYADDVRTRIPATEKARSVLGWEPTVTLEEALEICLDRVVSRV
ncbi:MAG: NAD-dependent epimerase/dehydratase family protein [Blastocatellia bacterium]|nr:NAD-dependent epimerase/dehydratase family protein [Blastocatellia bacterium]